MSKGQSGCYDTHMFLKKKKKKKKKQCKMGHYTLRSVQVGYSGEWSWHWIMRSRVQIQHMTKTRLLKKTENFTTK